MDQMNIDLTYSVCFNLAAQYEANEMYAEVCACARVWCLFISFMRSEYEGNMVYSELCFGLFLQQTKCDLLGVGGSWNAAYAVLQCCVAMRHTRLTYHCVPAPAKWRRSRVSGPFRSTGLGFGVWCLGQGAQRDDLRHG